MKKILAVFICIVLMIGCLSGCVSGAALNAADEDTLKIVATIFPEYDWVMNILGDNPANADVLLLLDNGTDLHSFQPTVQDILNISSCDLLIYVGGESDAWINDVLREAVNKDMKTVCLMDVLENSVKEEELVQGMQEGRPGTVNNRSEEDCAEEEPEYDEHVWLSLRNAALIVDSIEKALEELDPGNAQTYRDNAAAYKNKLDSLDEEYRKVISESPLYTLLFADRFPFRYLTDDYGLSYYAAFAGCSAETEASFNTIVFLIEKVDELSLPAVLIIDGADDRLAQTIVRSTRSKTQDILTLNSLQSITSKDIRNGASYLSAMEENLEVLKKALGNAVS